MIDQKNSRSCERRHRSQPGSPDSGLWLSLAISQIPLEIHPLTVGAFDLPSDWPRLLESDTLMTFVYRPGHRREVLDALVTSTSHRPIHRKCPVK